MSDVNDKKAKLKLQRAVDMEAERQTSAYARTVLERLTDPVDRRTPPESRA
jgi:hypothetical protein